jgi:hypothetical protein
VLALGCAAAPASAQEGPTPLQRMLGNWGLLQIPSDDPIDYRERAPLVVPPSNELPVPYGTQDVAAAVPDWPTDPEITERRKQREEARRPVDRSRDAFYSGRLLTADEMRRGTRQIERSSAPAPTVEPEKTAGRDRPTGSRSLWSLFKGDAETPVQFAGEPPRGSLTDPPPGYLTPSPNAPYGVVEKEKPGTRIGSPYDRLLAPGDPAGPR